MSSQKLYSCFNKIFEHILRTDVHLSEMDQQELLSIYIYILASLNQRPTSLFKHNKNVFINNNTLKILWKFTATQLTYLTGTCKYNV